MTNLIEKYLEEKTKMWKVLCSNCENHYITKKGPNSGSKCPYCGGPNKKDKYIKEI